MIREISVRAGDDDEVREWSLFMGRPVSPLEVFDLKVRFAAMLRIEGWDPEHQEHRGAPFK